MKQCKDCGEVFELENFPKNKNMKSGRLNICKGCKKKTDKKYYGENKKRSSRKARERYLTNKEQIKARVKKNRDENKDHINAKTRFLREIFPERFAEYEKRKYKKRRDVILAKLASPEGRAKANAANAKRRALKLMATPAWANNSKIKEIYKKAKDMEIRDGIKYHVDHIFPLQSPILCGLHCEDNLQILTEDENRRKYNKVSL